MLENTTQRRTSEFKDDSTLRSSIEELKRCVVANELKIKTFEEYQKERNHDIFEKVSEVNSKIELLRVDFKIHMEKEEELNKSFLKKGIWFLGAIVGSLVAYIWQNMVGHN